MTLGSTIGNAMADAAHAAVLGRAIGDARSQADAAERNSLEWQEYAGKLEDQNRELKGLLAAEKVRSNFYEAKSNRLEVEVSRLGEEAQKFAHLAVSESQTNSENVKYGRLVKHRLSQMEKALRYSSADREFLSTFLSAHQDVVGRLSLENELPKDLRDRAELVWNKFIKGEKLTENEQIQALVDAAPMPEKTRLVEI